AGPRHAPANQVGKVTDNGSSGQDVALDGAATDSDPFVTHVTLSGCEVGGIGRGQVARKISVASTGAVRDQSGEGRQHGLDPPAMAAPWRAPLPAAVLRSLGDVQA